MKTLLTKAGFIVTGSLGKTGRKYEVMSWCIILDHEELLIIRSTKPLANLLFPQVQVSIFLVLPANPSPRKLLKHPDSLHCYQCIEINLLVVWKSRFSSFVWIPAISLESLIPAYWPMKMLGLLMFYQRLKRWSNLKATSLTISS